MKHEGIRRCVFPYGHCWSTPNDRNEQVCLWCCQRRTLREVDAQRERERQEPQTEPTE